MAKGIISKEYRRRFIFTLAFLSLWLFIPDPAFSHVDVSTDVTSDSTWLTGEVYVVDGSVVIGLNAKLTVEPGAIIKFKEGSSLIIDGNLEVNGTPSNKSYFTSFKDDSIGGDTNGDGSATSPSPGDWNMIRANPGSVANIDYGVLRFGGSTFNGAIIKVAGTVSISNSSISQSLNSGVFGVWLGVVNIDSTTISNNYYGIYNDEGTVNVTNSILKDNLHSGFYNFRGLTFKISNSSITGNGLFGALTSLFHVVDARDNWWGDPSGPTNFGYNPGGQGDEATEYITFFPWLTSPPSFVSMKEPVIIVPGILGSRLNRVSDGEEVWPNVIEMIKPGADNYLNDLILSTSGEQIFGKELATSEILEEAWPFTVYGNLVNAFRDKGYVDGQDLFTVAYDWRFSVQDSVDALASIVQEALDNSPTGKVNIIAHSMGGLVTKEYLSRPGVSASVNKVVLIGVPNLGAPKAFKVLNYGDDFDLSKFGIGLNAQKAKEISQNMPGVYELLPSREYIRLKGGYVRDFRNGQNLTLGYDQTNNFVINNLSLSDDVLINAADIYHQGIDTNPIIGPTVFNIIGCQNPDTVGEIRLYDNGKADITAVDGDGTVPLISARANSDTYNNYYVLYSQTEIDHTGLVKNNNLTDFVSDLITEINPTLPSGVSQAISECLDALPDSTRIIFSTHSPVSLHIYDDQNRHTGLNADGDFEAGIPGSSFYMIGENSFASVPAGIGYRVIIDALSAGSFDFKIKSYNGSVLASSAAYLNMPLADELFTATLNFTGVDSNLELNIDQNGDGIVDQIKEPDVELSVSGNEDVAPPIVAIIEPVSDSYTRFSILPIQVSANDSESGVGLIQKYFDEKLVASESLDLFFEKLGDHSTAFIAYDKSGNPTYVSKIIQIISTPDSAISDIERSYDLGWIEKKAIRNSLINKLKSAIKIERRIELLEEKLPGKSRIIKQIEKLEKRLDRVLGTAFLNQLEKEYNKGNINQRAYDILKEDILWLLGNQ